MGIRGILFVLVVMCVVFIHSIMAFEVTTDVLETGTLRYFKLVVPAPATVTATLTTPQEGLFGDVDLFIYRNRNNLLFFSLDLRPSLVFPCDYSSASAPPFYEPDNIVIPKTAITGPTEF